VAIEVLAQPNVLFQRFLSDAGSHEAARVHFQTMITDLVAVEHPTADEVEGPGGTDWGIDTYVGSLSGTTAVWQSKFFLDWRAKEPGKSQVQQNQVRTSFNELMEQAAKHGIKLDSWTLCIPCVLPPEEVRWFEGFAKRNSKKHGVTITMLNAVRLRRMLQRPEAEALRNLYFSAQPAKFAEPVEPLHDPSAYDAALFVRQLQEAGQSETDAARGFFFAAEALARDIADRAQPDLTRALQELDLELHGVWSDHYNSKAPLASYEGRMTDLVKDVMRDAAQCVDPPGLALRPAHRRGMVHRIVEDARAGWVTHWREVASNHHSTTGGSTGGADGGTSP
jgi:hypothetical protein